MWRNLCEISCGQFPWKLKDEINRKFRKNFAAFFISLLEHFFQKFHLNFALGDYRHKNLAREGGCRFTIKVLRIYT